MSWYVEQIKTARKYICNNCGCSQNYPSLVCPECGNGETDNQNAIKAAEFLKKYCLNFGTGCKGCLFYNMNKDFERCTIGRPYDFSIPTDESDNGGG